MIEAKKKKKTHTHTHTHTQHTPSKAPSEAFVSEVGLASGAIWVLVWPEKREAVSFKRMEIGKMNNVDVKICRKKGGKIWPTRSYR